MNEIDAATAVTWTRKGEAVLVDVRSAGEFAAGHAAGALHVPLGQLSPKALPQGTRKVALICASGARSSAGCEVLLPHGLEAFSVKGGTSAWARAGGAIEADPGAASAAQGKLMAGAVVVLGLALSAMVHPAFLALTAVAGAHFVKLMMPKPAASSCSSGGAGQTSCATPGSKGKTSGCAGCGARNAG